MPFIQQADSGFSLMVSYGFGGVGVKRYRWRADVHIETGENVTTCLMTAQSMPGPSVERAAPSRLFPRYHIVFP